eukprot:11201559-Lingulodinium_polyedra.AAC.1
MAAAIGVSLGMSSSMGLFGVLVLMGTPSDMENQSLRSISQSVSQSVAILAQGPCRRACG